MHHHAAVDQLVLGVSCKKMQFPKKSSWCFIWTRYNLAAGLINVSLRDQGQKATRRTPAVCTHVSTRTCPNQCNTLFTRPHALQHVADACCRLLDMGDAKQPCTQPVPSKDRPLMLEPQEAVTTAGLYLTKQVAV